MVRAETVILNKLGLHARASAKLTQLASSFDSDVWMEKGARRINAKSIMGVMMLAAGKGSTVIVETTGNDEQAASEAILALIAERFGEAE
ncbi:MAG: Phosphocarrier protein HPr [Candidatus Accumulibacter regalis]|jgi:phosphocarrier protein HPr|uniref:Phosphocarrier protein HPr n=1 Tax=Accumulibacter regalis TaxID=522306 RepID=A0A011P281_ACCRE|nr:MULTISPECIES: HPr family phosphocarrier protein [unclassified Candidatus Accumulibacter]EXI89083.1 MAG: Phosphocarrier protein HPr [Candidatus Accumulibacter regalis]MQM33504.1 HPr family phosphocarrier protein [Candidatus Accumulibacter phosphatis]MBL8367077.1 HPr family phosphocarrier protein [Accumulibacter sp.]MBN8515848.1 HPr family phosphocarrier protein [Accumulibacter sp.]MBO3704289.1 HPr family phosphocarrier protein [Accumulibacter sp.]